MENLSLGKLGFYWRMTAAPNVPLNPVPDFVDFEFSFLEESQLLIQTRNSKTWEYLETIYRENFNVGYLQEGHALAEAYGGDFIGCVESALASYHPQARRISEVGAGGCYILKKLKEKGYDVAAIDPSPIAIEKGSELGIEVIPEFYPPEKAIQKSDVILHYDVLEHVPDPVGFIRSHATDLNPGGVIVFAVPDCSPYIAYGDISMILHEHLNYYNEEALQNVVEASGFEVLEIQKAKYGGVLYCIARKPESPVLRHPKTGTKAFDEFVARVQNLGVQVDAFISKGVAPSHTIGFYVPLRAVPYLSMRGLTSDFRFFDDNPGIHGQYFDGFPIPVENMNDLLANPVTDLLILSFAFGDKIRARINEQLPGHTINIRCLSDFDIS